MPPPELPIFLAFMMVSLHSPSSRSMKEMLLSLRALVSIGFSTAQSCFSFFLSCFRHAGPNFRPQLFRSVSCLNFCKSPPNHMYLLGGFSFNYVNIVNPFQESDEPRCASTFQKSSIRFSCNTSQFACVVLFTSMYFSGTRNVSSFGT